MTGGRGVPRILSIAGTDPTGGAGLQADLKSIAAGGGYGMAVLTALVAQNTRGVRSVHVPPVAFLAEQLDSVSDDVVIDAVKIGMLANRDVIDTVAAWLDRARPPLVVLDPVVVATSGDRLLDADAEAALRAILSRVDAVTPNVPELAVLLDEDPAADWAGVLAQAERLSSRYRLLVLAKGGHLGGEQSPDALVDASASGAGRVVEFAGERIPTTNTHGTGCSLSSALATRRVLSGSWREAVAASKTWLSESIRHGADLDVGSGNGPISHFAGLWSRGGLATRPTASEVEVDWWSSIQEIRDDIDGLPFVSGLATGALDPGDFRWYLAQDALYLREFSTALAHAGRLAPTLDEQRFWALSAHRSLESELQVHEEWLPGVDLDSVEPGDVTTAYLDHLGAVAGRNDYAVLVAALLPCFWLYQDIGVRLHTRSHPEHPFRLWLDAYADEGFAAATSEAVRIITAAAARSETAARAAMKRAFVRSAEFEREFFRAASMR